MPPLYLRWHKPTPQTPASSAVHRGGELAPVIRAESEWGEQRRAVVLHDSWQAWLRTSLRIREQQIFCSSVASSQRFIWCLMQLLLNLKTRCLRIGAFEAIYGEESTIQEHLLVVNSFYSFELVLMSCLCLISARIHPDAQTSIAIAASLQSSRVTWIRLCTNFSFHIRSSKVFNKI